MSTDSLHSAAEAAVDSAAATAAQVLSPKERLELSRARMRMFLERKKPAAGASGLSMSSIGAKMSDWADGLRANPVTGAVVDAIQGWWARHPLHSVALMAGDAVEEVAVPWIRRYPLAMVGGALAAGVVVSKLKPWRWLGKPALFAGLTSQIAAQLMTNAPLEFLIDAFTSFAKPKASATADPEVARAAFEDTVPGIDPASSVPAPVPEPAETSPAL